MLLEKRKLDKKKVGCLIFLVKNGPYKSIVFCCWCFWLIVKTKGATIGLSVTKGPSYVFVTRSKGAFCWLKYSIKRPKEFCGGFIWSQIKNKRAAPIKWILTFFLLIPNSNQNRLLNQRKLWLSCSTDLKKSARKINSFYYYQVEIKESHKRLLPFIEFLFQTSIQEHVVCFLKSK
ncbi:hypothetical protein R6Q59_006341 [Mikania micrantha]